MNQSQRSPGKRISSPKKQRPMTAIIEKSLQEQVNEAVIQSQDKDIEIDRLRTTCYTLNTKSTVCHDLHSEVEMLHKRLREADQINQVQKQEIADYERNRQEYERTRLQQKQENQVLSSQNKELKKDLNDALQSKTQLQRELETQNEYVLQMEEKVYKSNKISLELLKQLKDAEVEIATLQQYIVDLKQRIAVYIPMKDDRVDNRLAEFINNYPERSKLKIMFMRESEGVYQFGTKRVAVKCEQDSIKIRVGGGYLSIDEFLD